jgi:ATP-binding cassette subfamily B protein
MLWLSRRAVAAAPVMLTWTTFLSLLLAFVPALQVLVVAGFVNALGPQTRLVDVGGLLIALVALVGLTPAVTAICEDFQHRAAQRLQAELNADLAREASRIPPDELVGSSVAVRVERHSRAIGEGIAWSFSQYVRAVKGAVTSIAVIATVFTFSPLAGLLTLLALVPPVLYGRFISHAYERQWVEVSPHYDRERYLRELVVRQRPATELASLGTAERIGGMVADRWRTIDTIMARALRPQTIGSGLSSLVTALLIGGAFLAVLLGADVGPSAVAGIYAVLSATGAATGAAFQAGTAIEQLPQVAALRDFLDVRRPTRIHPITRPVSSLRADRLRHRYADRDRDAIRDVTVHAERGEIIALVGVNGAGKTTTVDAILGLITPRGGTITCDGVTREDVGEAAWLSRFGLLTQEFERFELTVRETVLLGTSRTDVTDGEIWAALRSAHAEELVASMPGGLDQQLGEQWGGVGISGGQWQRLSLARIYLRDAPVWILDEPTSAIDAEAEQDVFHELQRTKAGRITVVVSHRAWTLKGMDRIYVFDDGRIVQQGRYEDLLDSDGRFARIFAEQA